MLWLLWLCFVARGFFYCALLPLWEGYDEPSHFAFIQYLEAHHSLPVITTPVSREVEASLHLVPLSWEQRLHVLAPPIYTEDAYWQLPERSRQELHGRLRSIPREWQRETGAAPTMYEAQQAPLYYWIMSAPAALAWRWELPERVMLLRLLSVLLASLLVPIAYAAATLALNSRTQALALAATLTCMPELMIDISRVGNESLGVVVFSLFTLLMLVAVTAEDSRLFLAAGVVLGLGLLSKAYFLTAVPAFVLLALYSAFRRGSQHRSILLHAAGGLCVAAIVSAGWYWRNHSLTGSWSGEINDVNAAHGGIPHLLAAVPHVNWAGGVISVLVSHVWFGGWSFLKLAQPIYVVFLIGMTAALLGLARLVATPRLRRDPRFLVLFTIYAFFWLGLLYDMLITYVSVGSSSSTGWYMYAVVLSELLLVALAVYTLVPERFQRTVLPALAASFAAIDLYGVFFLLIPYYTGLIAHLAGSDIVKPLPFGRLFQTSPGLVLQRLTVNRPDWMGPAGVSLLAFLYLVATVAAVLIAFLSVREVAAPQSVALKAE